METWIWHSVKPTEIKFFDFYMRVVRKYGHINGDIKINWKGNGKRYKFVFDQVDDNISGIELYVLVKNND